MFGVALIDCKNAWNLGNALRSTVAFGGSFFIVQGKRWINTGDWVKTDTENARHKIPLYLGVDDMMEKIPYGTRLVGVEMVPHATPISNFEHHDNDLFVFGPEDGRIPDNILSRCEQTIYLPTAYSLNLAACVACIGHDRMLKEDKKEGQFCPSCKKKHIKWLDNISKWHCNACGHEWNYGIVSQ